MNQKEINFIRFKEVGSKLGNYIISINRHGAFGLNSGFYRAEEIANFSYAMMFYAKEERFIAISFTNNKEEKGVFKITHAKSKTSGSIVARSFLMTVFSGNKEELVKHAGGYTPKTYKDDNFGKLFYIDLKEKELDN